MIKGKIVKDGITIEVEVDTADEFASIASAYLGNGKRAYNRTAANSKEGNEESHTSKRAGKRPTTGIAWAEEDILAIADLVRAKDQTVPLSYRIKLFFKSGNAKYPKRSLGSAHTLGCSMRAYYNGKDPRKALSGNVYEILERNGLLDYEETNAIGEKIEDKTKKHSILEDY